MRTFFPTNYITAVGDWCRGFSVLVIYVSREKSECLEKHFFRPPFKYFFVLRLLHAPQGRALRVFVPFLPLIFIPLKIRCRVVLGFVSSTEVRNVGAETKALKF